LILAEVIRSGYVEGTHHGHVLAVRPDGSTALALGDVRRPIFPRSSNKPLQAAAMLGLGWAPESDEQLALATASHNGEPGHVSVVQDMLGDLELQCPAQPPLDDKTWREILRSGGDATRLTMNCSGKHAAMLRTCVANDWDTATYTAPQHPLQLAIKDALAGSAGERVEHIAVDGCGAPQHSLSLTGLARAYARLDPRVRSAMSGKPWHVAGTGRDVTRLMEALPGLVVKDGAEGVCAALLPDG
jgi:L-asparaginase II